MFVIAFVALSMCLPLPASAGDLDTGETTHLIFMREEEKLARDVYLAMHDKWGERMFGNISQAESRHMSAIANLLVGRVTESSPAQQFEEGRRSKREERR